jgi:ribosomal subunit interface protein
MKIITSARHMELTESLKTEVENRLSHLHGYGLELNKAEVVLNCEHQKFQVTMVVHGNNVNIDAESEKDDMHEAIHDAVDKLEKQMEKRSGHLIKHKH